MEVQVGWENNNKMKAKIELTKRRLFYELFIDLSLQMTLASSLEIIQLKLY